MTTLSDFQKTDLVDDHVAADYNRLIGAVLRAEFVNTETISATKELTDDDCQFQVITASGGNQIMKLAPEATTNHTTLFYNATPSSDGYTLTVKDDSGALTYITLAPDELAMFLPIVGEGWKLISSTSMVWRLCLETWTRTGDHTFTVSGDLTGKYRKGTRVRYKQGGSYEYGVVKSSSYGAPDTTVTLIANTDYAMAAATVTDTYISYFEQPGGFPYEFNFSASLTNVTVGSGTLVQKFRAGFGMFVYQVEFTFESSGSPSAITGDVSFTPPVTPLSYSVNARDAFGVCTFYDSSVPAAYSGSTLLNTSENLSARAHAVSGSYLFLTLVSSTAPFTWADGDVLTMNGGFKW